MLPSSGDKVRYLADKSSAPYAYAQGRVLSQQVWTCPQHVACSAMSEDEAAHFTLPPPTSMAPAGRRP